MERLYMTNEPKALSKRKPKTPRTAGDRELIPPHQSLVQEQEEASSSIVDPFTSPESKAAPLTLDEIEESGGSPFPSMMSKYKVKPKDVVRYEIVKYRVSPMSRDAQPVHVEGLPSEKATEKRSSSNSRRVLSGEAERHAKSTSSLRSKKPSTPVLLGQGPGIFSPLGGGKIHDSPEEDEDFASTTKKRKPSSTLQPSHSAGQFRPVLPPNQAHFSTKQQPRAVFTTNAVIRRPSTGETLSIGKPRFLATPYTTNYAPPDQLKEAAQTGLLFFQPTRCTSTQRAFKDRRGGSPTALSPLARQTAPYKFRGQISGGAGVNSPRHMMVEESEFLSQMVRQLFARINKLRAKPRSWVGPLSQRLGKYRDSVYLLMGDGQYKKTKEGRVAVEEAIGELEKAEGLPPLELSKGLLDAAQEHRRYLSSTGKVTAYSSELDYGAKKVQKHGKVLGRVEEFHCAFGVDDVDEVILKMLIGDGDPKRKGRQLLLSPFMNKVGLSVGSHVKEGFIASIIAAAEFITHGEKGLRVFYSRVECEVFRYLNMIRSAPRKFARLVRADLDYFAEAEGSRGGILRPPGRHARQYEEGKTVFLDLLEFLDQVQPVPELAWEPCLQLVACKRVAEVGATGQSAVSILEHAKDVAVLFGSIFDKVFVDFTSAYEVALSFVLCDGDPHRHNRTVLFNEEYHKGAVATHYDEGVGLLHAIGLADDVLELSEPKFDVLFKKKMKEVAVDCVREINKIRSNPHYAVDECERLLDCISEGRGQGHVYRRPGGMIIPMSEGGTAVLELLQDLKDLIEVSERKRKLGAPFVSILRKLKYSSWLSRACYEHCFEMAKYNYLDHERKRPAYGKDFGSQQERYVYIKGDAAESLHGGHGYGREIAWSLLIDDGVKSRGHRCQMLAREFKYVGIGVGLHPSRGLATTINYFEDFEPIIRVYHK